MRNLRPLARACLLAAAGLLAAGPLLAYTIYLKDGSSIQAKEKYRVVNGRAIILLLNGTQSFVDADKIDVRRTEEANRVDYGGNAVIIQTPQAPAPPPPTQDRKLSDLVASRGDSQLELPQARRSGPGPQEDTRARARTKAGFQDLSTLARKPYAQLEVAADIQAFLRSQGVDEVEIYQGTEANRPLLEFSTPSEAVVFRSLQVAANALLHVRDTQPKVTGFELLMTTPDRQRAGQFVLTPELAAELAAKSLEVSTFYLRNVQF
jgi:hypothetical protein